MCNLVIATPQKVQSFCDNAGRSLKTFRYFNSRPFTTISNHLITYILTNNEGEVAYGHLDPEGDLVWLGICVGENYLGQGYGKIMMQHLINYANLNGISSIMLSVDTDNISAISLYNKVGFVTVKTTDSIHYMKLEMTNE